MARMVWMAIGAAGGILAYKKVSRVVDDARGRSLVGNVNAATATANSLVERTKHFVAAASGPDSATTQAAGEASLTDGGAAASDTVASRLRAWIPPRSDDASSSSSQVGGIRRSQAPH